jgi:protease I
MTSWPGVRDDLVNAGATWLDQEFVRDGNLGTSRGPQDLNAFIRGTIDLFAESAPIVNNEHGRAASSPQAKEPPEVVLSAMKWLPKPSIPTAVLLGAAGWGLFAMTRRRSLGLT